MLDITVLVSEAILMNVEGVRDIRFGRESADSFTVEMESGDIFSVSIEKEAGEPRFSLDMLDD